MPIFEQYYFTFDTKQRVVASSRPQNNSTVESLCMASDFDSSTYSRSRQLMYDSYNDSFLFMETHRLRNTTEGRAVRFIHSYQLSERSADPRCYLAPVDFNDGEDGSFRNTADLPQCQFERSRKSVKEIARYYLSVDPSAPVSLDEVRNKLEKIITVLYKNVVFGFDKLLIHWIGKSDDELCIDGCDMTLMMHLLTPPSRRKYLSADTNILGSTSLAKKLNFTNTTAALKNAGAIIEISNSNVNVLRTSISTEKVCERLVSNIAVAALTSDEQLQELLEKLDGWLSAADTSAGDVFVNLGLYAFLGRENISPSKYDVDLSKFAKVIAPPLWQNAKDEFKRWVQLLLDEELSNDDIQVQKAAFDKVLSLAKQVGEHISCKSGEYYEIFANSLARLHRRNEDACSELCKELKNLRGGINSAAERMINKIDTDNEHRELLTAVQSDLIELPKKFKDREQLMQYIKDFPQLVKGYSTDEFISKSVDLYMKSNDGKSIISVFKDTVAEKKISCCIVKTLQNEKVELIPNKVNRFIDDGIGLDEDIKGIIVDNLRRLLNTDSVSNEQIYAVIEIADRIGRRNNLKNDIGDVYFKKLKAAKTPVDLYEVVESSILPIWQTYKLNFADKVVVRAADFCKNAFGYEKEDAPTRWAETLEGVYKCGELLNYDSYRNALDGQISTSRINAYHLYKEKYCSNTVNRKARLANWRKLREFEVEYLSEEKFSCVDDIEEAFASALELCNTVSGINELKPETGNQIALAKERISVLLDEKFRDVKTMGEFASKKRQYEVVAEDIDPCLRKAVNDSLKAIEARLQEETKGTIAGDIYKEIIDQYNSGKLTDLETCENKLIGISRRHGGAYEIICAVREDKQLTEDFSELYFCENRIIDDSSVKKVFCGVEQNIYSVFAAVWVRKFNEIIDDKEESFRELEAQLSFITSPDHGLAVEAKNRMINKDLSDFICRANMDQIVSCGRMVYVANEETTESYFNRILTLIKSKEFINSGHNLFLCCHLLKQLSICEEALKNKKLDSKCSTVCDKLLKKCKEIISKIYTPDSEDELLNYIDDISKTNNYHKDLKKCYEKAKKNYQKKHINKVTQDKGQRKNKGSEKSKATKENNKEKKTKKSDAKPNRKIKDFIFFLKNDPLVVQISCFLFILILLTAMAVVAHLFLKVEFAPLFLVALVVWMLLLVIYYMFFATNK